MLLLLLYLYRHEFMWFWLFLQYGILLHIITGMLCLSYTHRKVTKWTEFWCPFPQPVIVNFFQKYYVDWWGLTMLTPNLYARRKSEHTFPLRSYLGWAPFPHDGFFGEIYVPASTQILPPVFTKGAGEMAPNRNCSWGGMNVSILWAAGSIINPHQPT